MKWKRSFTGPMSGLLTAIPEKDSMEAMINMMVAEAIKNSEIEGEYLSRVDVFSSIRNNLGLNEKKEPVKDKKAAGAGELMVLVRNTVHVAINRANAVFVAQHSFKPKFSDQCWRMA